MILMKLRYILLFAVSSLFMFSCVSTKKFKEMQAKMQARYDSLAAEYAKLQGDLKNCNDATASLTSKNTGLQGQIDELNKQIAFLRENNTQALKQLEDMSVISSSQAESIKKSLENIGAKDAYIRDLQAAMAHKDSLNMALVMNLKGAVSGNDSDINIKVDRGVIFIDISDKLLFKSGRYEVTKGAKEVLGKVAAILKNQPDVDFMVEGNTDNKVYHGHPDLIDNWDLSCKRATSVVRILAKTYGIPPAKMTAAGRGEFVPLMTNDTNEGRAANRRTRIVILPELDQFFKLLEHKG
jgi:chemotaxis protein MotB